MSNILKAAINQGVGENPNAWDVSYTVLGTAEEIKGDVTKLERSTSVTATGLSTGGFFIKPDGTKAFQSSDVGTGVRQYTLNVPWNFEQRTLIGSTVNFSGGTGNGMTGNFFSPDGTKYFATAGGDGVDEYALSTPWDITSYSFTQSFSTATETSTNNEGLTFSTDGTKMYVTADNTAHTVYQYDLSTAWDISTASYTQSFSVNAQDNDARGVGFSPDGKIMFVSGRQNKSVYQYNLSTAWDISSATYIASKLIEVSTNVNFYGPYVSPNLDSLYFGCNNNDAVFRWSFLNYLDVSAQETLPVAISFKDDGTKLYVLGSAGDDVNEYDLSTAWLLTSASYVQSFSVVSQESAPRGMFFKPDGTKFYIVGETNRTVDEYSLSTAWDISSASHVQGFSVNAQETAPSSLFFKDDGTKMYVLGTTGDDVNEYDLSTPWDVSSASYLQNFSVASQETAPNALFFKPDGTKMYVVGQNGDDINEYALSTPWDISTASYTTTFDIQSLVDGTIVANTQALFWHPDGTVFFVADSTPDAVFAFNISPT